MGRPLDRDQIHALRAFREWLLGEALPGGGIGPNEKTRVDTRHIADSLLFSHFLGKPELVYDLGSGVGLPGIPLAILYPDTRFVLVDRSQRRVDMVERAIRVLGLANTEVRCTDIASLEEGLDHVVSRASLPPEQLGGLLTNLLRPQGTAVAGGSWRSPPTADGWVTEEVHSDALDRTIWFLIMRQQ